MVTYEPRSAWTSTARGGGTLTGSKLIGVSVHYPATDVTIGTSRDGAIRRLQGYWDFHVNTRGWSDIGYQVAVDQAGRVWDLRGITRVPAASASEANPDANHEWGACLFLVGNTEQPSTAAIEAFQHWRTTQWLRRWPNAPSISGHGQVPGASTSCPGAPLRELIADGALHGNPVPPPTPLPKDWFDMATQNDLIVAMRKVLDEATITSPNGDTKAPKWSIRHLLDWAGRGLYNISTRLAKTDAKADAILEAVSKIPGVDAAKLAADVAAAVERISAEDVIDELSERLTEDEQQQA